ncbi:venom metalloproteinase 2 [Fopius arisanus]|uniref:Venom metalloproteinase 2 n=2 Tax=Fopius arisanus TaxID=64838 RepID=A0A9R1T4R6_9HYME|nr:PREDICTED: venom metalloproteinase 2-like [Fopius arisanus]
MRGLPTLLWGIAALCAANAVPVHQLHERMTPTERLQIFQTSDVPEYEITSIHWPRVERRSADGSTGIYLKAFGADIELWLKPTDSVLAGYDTPVYLLKSGDSAPKITKFSNVMERLDGFEDTKKSAALVVRRREDKSREMIGTIGSEHLVIAPIPERLIGEVRRQRRSADDIAVSEQDDHHYHIVYKRSPSSINVEHPEPLLARADTQTESPQLPIPDTVYPELLIVVANDLYKKLGNDFWHSTAYILAFWNSVDLRYRTFQNPKFRLNIAGIVLAEDPEVLVYLAANAEDENTTVATPALRESGTYWYARKDDIPIENYDIVVTMTSKALCNFYKGDPNCHPGTLGMAFIAAACKRSDYFKELGGSVLLTDSAAFDGVHTAVHELGHSFGARHDTTECPHTDGFIMAGVPHLNENSSDWSKCTVRQIQNYLETGPTCLYNKPHKKNILPRYLPGSIMTADQQCQKLEGTKACEVDELICQRLMCIRAGRDDNYCGTMGNAAADGTHCGGGNICLNARCVRPPKF